MSLAFIFSSCSMSLAFISSSCCRSLSLLKASSKLWRVAGSAMLLSNVANSRNVSDIVNKRDKLMDSVCLPCIYYEGDKLETYIFFQREDVKCLHMIQEFDLTKEDDCKKSFQMIYNLLRVTKFMLD